MRQQFLSFLTVAAVLSLSACGSFLKSEEIDYRHSVITPTLEVPPDLISRSADQNLDLPGSHIGKPENSGRFVETGNLNIESRTLPVFNNLSLQGQGDMHWLVVPDVAEKVFPLIRNYWSEQGFILTVDEPAVGIMETNWLESKTATESFMASLFESFSGADSKDQYKTRLERSDDNLETRVYVSHRGQELVIEEEAGRRSFTNFERSSGWQMAPSDPDKEYEMLARMMISLGMQDEGVKAELEKIGLFAARAVIEYDDEDEETYLLVKQGFEQTWNRLVHQLDRIAVPVTVQDKNDNDGKLMLEKSGLEELAENEVAGLTLELEGLTARASTRIDVLDSKGSIDKSERGKKVLQFLLQNLK